MAAAQSNADRIIDYELANSKAHETLSYLTDNIGARPSGSKSAEMAVKWTTKRFRDWGVDVRNQKMMSPHWVRGEEHGRLVSHNNQKIVLTALGGSIATPPAGITADVVEITSYEQLEKLGREKIKGKIVFYNSPMDMDLIERGRAIEAYGKSVVFR